MAWRRSTKALLIFLKPAEVAPRLSYEALILRGEEKAAEEDRTKAQSELMKFGMHWGKSRAVLQA